MLTQGASGSDAGSFEESSIAERTSALMHEAQGFIYRADAVVLYFKTAGTTASRSPGFASHIDHFTKAIDSLRDMREKYLLTLRTKDSVPDRDAMEDYLINFVRESHMALDVSHEMLAFLSNLDAESIIDILDLDRWIKWLDWCIHEYEGAIELFAPK